MIAFFLFAFFVGWCVSGIQWRHTRDRRDFVGHMELRARIHEPNEYHRKYNQFQLNRRFVSQLVSNLRGTTCQVRWASMTGYSKRDHGNRLFDVTLSGAACSKDERLRIFGESVDEASKVWEVELSPESLLDVHARIDWRPPDPRLLQKFEEKRNATEPRRRSTERARAIGEMLPEEERSGRLVITLDGDGENLEGFRDAGWPHGSVHRYEVDAVVALGQKLLYPDSPMRYTEGDDVMSPRCGKGMLERILVETNKSASLLSDEDRRRAAILYLDYCGGPRYNQAQDPEKRKCKNFLTRVLGALPNLRVFALTMSKRRHGNLKIDAYMDVPYGFRLRRVFTENPRVICWAFTAESRCALAVPRRLSVPGLWWNNCSRRDKFLLFGATVVAYDAHRKRYKVAVDGENEFVEMTKRCVVNYADATHCLRPSKRRRKKHAGLACM